MARHDTEMLCIPFAKGRLAQLVEHLVYTERVSGSSPLAPTMHFYSFSRNLLNLCGNFVHRIPKKPAYIFLKKAMCCDRFGKYKIAC
jgi:hypothetical protein